MSVGQCDRCRNRAYREELIGTLCPACGEGHLQPLSEPIAFLKPGERIDFLEASDPYLTWLDQAAMLAMAHMVAGEGARMVAERDERYDETNWAQIVASNAYDFAEALLAEKLRREKGRKP